MKITAVGPAAIEHLDDVWESCRVAGADLAIGLGEDHIPFDVERGDATDSMVTLPTAEGDSRNIPALRVQLTSD